MDAGLPGVEFEAHGQVAPAVEKNEEKTSKRPENRQIPAFFMPKSKICRFPGRQVRQAASDIFGRCYTVIDRVERLPQRLPELFMALTR
ncbi:MAG: hypothetical protein JNL00_03410 [Candidatus Accumulibacter sp.]|nr:hypothetical protein [Accumulibacter sp.]